MGIHYDYKSTRGAKAMEKQAKREKKLAEKRAKKQAKAEEKGLVEKYKKEVEIQEQQLQQQPSQAQTADPKAVRWASDNEWFGKDNIMTAAALAIDGDLKNQDIGIKNNKIVTIKTKIDEDAKDIYDATNLIVLPGCIDTQTHFREPGSTDTEDLHSGSRAAIVGGITSVFEMPNTNPPTSNKVEFQKKLDLAKNRMYCNYAFYFGATADNANELSNLKDLEGVRTKYMHMFLPTLM